MLLSSCPNVVCEDPRDIWVVCDNANKCRSVLKSTQDNDAAYTQFRIKQDPMHVPFRFSRHAKSECKNNVKNKITSALWGDGKLKPKKDMIKAVRFACDEMLVDGWILAAQEEPFKRTMESNIHQIKMGDLDYDGLDHKHLENGQSYSTLSTSQVMFLVLFCIRCGLFNVDYRWKVRTKESMT